MKKQLMNKIGDVIYRQDAINAIENTECELTPAAWDEITDAINEVLSADVQPIRYGYWIYTPTSPLSYTCSECGETMCQFNYCPNCGAKMII